MESCFQRSSVFESCVGVSRRFLIICLLSLGGVGRKGPTLANPVLANPFLANPFLANPFLANPFLDLVCVMAPRVGPKPRERVGFGRVGPRRVGAPKGGGPKMSRFFPPLLHLSLFLSLSGCLLVEFWWCLKRRALTCAPLEFSGCVKPRRLGALGMAPSLREGHGPYLGGGGIIFFRGGSRILANFHLANWPNLVWVMAKNKQKKISRVGRATLGIAIHNLQRIVDHHAEQLWHERVSLLASFEDDAVQHACRIFWVRARGE